jgi:hypothetical protein
MAPRGTALRTYTFGGRARLGPLGYLRTMESSPPDDHDTAFEAYRRLLEREAEPAAQDTLRLALESRGRRQAGADKTRASIAGQWSVGWDYWDAVTYALQQNGLHMLERSSVEDAHSKVRDALLLLHCSATLTFQEVGTLLREGFWAGAAARWRALHEVAVTALLISQSRPDLAERYLDHGHVVQTRRLSEYMTAHGRGPVGSVELATRASRSQELIEHHTMADQGISFSAPYGWATPLMPLGKKGRRIPPTFEKLEELAGLKGLRLLVATAHGLVHNDSGGVVTSVVMESQQWTLGPLPRFVETVARPALISVQHAVASTHLGFEPDFNDTARLLGLLATTTNRLAAYGIASFETPAPSTDSGRV